MRRHPQQVRHGHGHYLPPSQLPGHGVGPAHHHGQPPQDHHAQPRQPPQQGAVAALAAPPPPGPTSHLTSTTFASLPLSAASQRSLAEVLRFTHLTEVQNATLPVVRPGPGPQALQHTLAGSMSCATACDAACPECDVVRVMQPLVQSIVTAGPKFTEKKTLSPALPQILTGADVMARAKTGTGKTMGFLIPSVEALVRQGRSRAAGGQGRGSALRRMQSSA